MKRTLFVSVTEMVWLSNGLFYGYIMVQTGQNGPVFEWVLKNWTIVSGFQMAKTR
jgi:hypothetical protein